jgi:hypothetical protein
MKLKLYRDNVVSVVGGRNLVGIYISPEDDKEFEIEPDGTILLAEVSPERADKIIKVWNRR